MTTFTKGLRRVKSRLSPSIKEPRVRRRLSALPPPPGESPFAVYFADGPDAVYQVDQWLPVFERLAASGTPVSLLMTNADSAARLLSDCPLPIELCTTSSATEAFVDTHRVRVIFYLNNNQANFTTLRINGPFHVHLSHGESEKSSMVSNQLKAYDAAFIAGPASRERILHHVRRIDPSHLVEVGRPQLDFPQPPLSKPHLEPVVLYAPTWEGDSSAMAYSSLAGTGIDLIRTLRMDPRVNLRFRPHPKTGTCSSKYARALREARLLIRESSPRPARQPKPPKFLDAISDISQADVVITDVSAMAMDAVGLNKPLMVLAPSAIPAASLTTRIQDHVTTWSTLPRDAVDQVLIAARNGPGAQQKKFRDHVFGPPELGTGTERFIQAAHNLLRSAGR